MNLQETIDLPAEQVQIYYFRGMDAVRLPLRLRFSCEAVEGKPTFKLTLYTGINGSTHCTIPTWEALRIRRFFISGLRLCKKLGAPEAVSD